MHRFLLSVLAFLIAIVIGSAALAQSNDGGWVRPDSDPGSQESGGTSRQSGWERPDGQTADEAALANMMRDRRHRPDGWDWFNEPFDDPVYLVRCIPVADSANACPGDGLMLVADLDAHPGAVFRQLGGPYEHRWQLEEDRARLAQKAGLPAQAVRVTVWNGAGRRIGQFWLGGQLACEDPPNAERALSSAVNAEFGPGLARPPANPLNYGIDDHWRDRERLKPICAERRAQRLRSAEARRGFGTPPSAAATRPGQPPAEIAARVVQTIETVYEECFKAPGTPAAAPATCKDLTIWTYVLNDGNAHADRREYDAWRKSQIDAGMQFAGATIKSEKRR